VWRLLSVTGLCQAIYYVALAGAYRSGDISVAYPLARSSPAVIVTLAALILGRSEQITMQAIIGIILVAVGSFMVPMRRFRELRLSSYWNLTCVLALVAAVGTAGYSLIDDEALRFLRDDAGIGQSAVVISLLYITAAGLFTGFWLTLFSLLNAASRREFRGMSAARKRRALAAGVVIYVTYSIVLVSMAFVRNVSYVVGFRQLSIPIGALLGVVLLGEPGYRPKAVGVVTLFVGLVLIGTG
jgi:drug/metabolite transporter (DMT)-like permease